MDPNDALTLLDLFAERASSMGWDRESGCLMINDDSGTQGNLMSQYALLSDDNITASKVTVMGIESRNSQDSYIIYQCLYRSMTRSVKSALSLRADDWQIEVNDGNTKNLVPSGPLYLKRIIAEARMDNTATLVALRQSVVALKVTIATVDYDIK